MSSSTKLSPRDHVEGGGGETSNWFDKLEKELEQWDVDVNGKEKKKTKVIKNSTKVATRKDKLSKEEDRGSNQNSQVKVREGLTVQPTDHHEYLTGYYM